MGFSKIAILYGFDNPRQKEHLLLSDPEKDVRRAVGNKRMIKLAIELAVEMHL
jgi:hypothetical protein